MKIYLIERDYNKFKYLDLYFKTYAEEVTTINCELEDFLKNNNWFSNQITEFELVPNNALNIPIFLPPITSRKKSKLPKLNMVYKNIDTIYKNIYLDNLFKRI